MPNTLTLWNSPFADFDTFVRRAFGPSVITRPMTGFTPAAEIARDGDDAVVRLELPGIDAEKDVSVEVTDNRLVVRGERRDERASEQDGRTLREVRYGAFSRSFTLPAGVAADAVSAGYDAGVLSVRVAGAYAVPAARRIAVTTGSGDPAGSTGTAD